MPHPAWGLVTVRTLEPLLSMASATRLKRGRGPGWALSSDVPWAAFRAAGPRVSLGGPAPPRQPPSAGREHSRALRRQDDRRVVEAWQFAGREEHVGGRHVQVDLPGLVGQV